MQIALKRVYKLKDVIDDIHSGGTPSTKQSEYWGGNLKWLSSGETSNSFIYETVEKITEAGVKNSSTKLAKKNDVVLACAGQGKTRGQVSYLEDDMYINQSVIALTANKSILDSLYLFYNLKNRYKELRGGSDSSSTRGSITTTSLKNLYIELPPLSVQQKIVSVLHSYDKLIQNHKKQIENLQNLAGELYKEWFVRFRFPGHEKASFENGIPAGWKVDKIKNRVKRLSFGKTYKKDEVLTDGEIIVIDQSESEYLGYHNGEPSHKATIDEPIALFGDHSCKYELMTRDFSLGENVIPFVSQNIDVYYLYYAVYKIVETEEYKRHWSLFINKKILIPEEKLQLMFRKYALSIKKQTEILSFQITNLSKQRALLLPRLMSGKLEVK